MNNGTLFYVKLLLGLLLDLVGPGRPPGHKPSVTPLDPMKTITRFALVLALALVPALSANAQRTKSTKAVVSKPLGHAEGVIEFVKPWTYTDVQITGSSSQDSLPVLLPNLGKWLVQEIADLLRMTHQPRQGDLHYADRQRQGAGVFQAVSSGRHGLLRASGRHRSRA